MHNSRHRVDSGLLDREFDHRLRTCKKCDIQKELSSFRKEKNCKSGYGYSCKKCINEKNRKIPVAPPGQQLCRTCLHFLPLDRFLKDKNCSSGYRYRCKECRNKKYKKKGRASYNSSYFKSGDKHPNYIDGKWKQRSMIGKGKKFQRIRKDVLKRDNYCCVKCPRNDLLHVHHIVPLRINKELAHDINNLITLCPKCHVHEEKKVLMLETSR